MSKPPYHPLNLHTREVTALQITLKDLLADGNAVSYVQGLHLQRVLDKLNRIGGSK